MSTTRTPPQGGLAPDGHRDVTMGPVVEIACDESGFSGTNLLDASTPLFTHASTDLGHDEAAELVTRLGRGLRWSRAEVKAGPLLRGPDADASLRHLVAALLGHAHVHVVDKALFLVSRVVDLVLAEPSYEAGTRLAMARRPATLALARAGRRCGPSWSAFLAALTDLVRTRRRRFADAATVEAFLRARDALADDLTRCNGAPTALDAATSSAAVDVLGSVRREAVESLVARLAERDRSVPPPLEPLVPALTETVLHWSAGTRRVLVVHDEQSALTPERIRRVQEVVARAEGRTPSALAGLVTVDSRDDPRVQVADLLAGAVRRSPDPFGDPVLAPFLSATSLVDTVRTRR